MLQQPARPRPAANDNDARRRAVWLRAERAPGAAAPLPVPAPPRERSGLGLAWSMLALLALSSACLAGLAVVGLLAAGIGTGELMRRSRRRERLLSAG
jgi:hypothetical protein